MYMYGRRCIYVCMAVDVCVRISCVAGWWVSGCTRSFTHHHPVTNLKPHTNPQFHGPRQVFLEWYEEGEEGDGRGEFTRREVTAEMAQSLRKGAAKFITWLTEAESSEEESGSDEGDDDSGSEGGDSD